MSLKSLINKMDEISADKTVEESTRVDEGKKWISGAIKDPGAFTKKAKAHDMSTGEFASHVLSHKDDYPAKTEKQAVLAKTLRKLKEEPENERPYICVHAKKGKCEVKAKSSYEAAKKAAEKWKMKSTAGIDAHLADTEHSTSSLEEATKETPTGRVHKAGPGGYGRKFDTDEEGDEKEEKAPEVKRGRGRPKKAGNDDSKKYGGAKDLQSMIVGNLPKKLPGKASVKHKMKDDSSVEESGVYRHKGTYGTSYDGDDKPVVQPEVKRGRGRPRKDADITGHSPTYDTQTLSNWIIGNLPSKLPGKASVKHKLKDWIEHVEKKTLHEGVVKEGRMAEVHLLIQDIINGNSDLHDVMNHPRDSVEKYLSGVLKDKAVRAGYDPMRDFDEVAPMVMKDLEDTFGASINEVALDPSQIAVPQLSGTPQQQASTGSTADKTPGMGAAVLDFKDPKDPLKNAIAQAVQNKDVTVITKESRGYNTSDSAERLKKILQNYPMEHRMAQEGWGVHESLYQALCDHYWDEGRIPRDVMHRSGQELRDYVEGCYSQDSEKLMENPLIGAAVSGLAMGAGKALTDKFLGDGVDEGVGSDYADKSFLRKSPDSGGLGRSIKDTLRGMRAFATGRDEREMMDRGELDSYRDLVDLEKLKESYTNSNLDAAISAVRDPNAQGGLKRLGDWIEKNVKADGDYRFNAQREMAYAIQQALEGGDTASGVSGVIKNINAGLQLREPGGLEKDFGRYLLNHLDSVSKTAKRDVAEDDMKSIFEYDDEDGPLDEKLTKDMPAGEIISDFQKSKDKRFVGKSREERKKMALGAYYGMHPEQSKKKTDEQIDIWTKQLNAMLTEGITLTTSTGHPGGTDSVSVNATDSDAAELMKLINASGLVKSGLGGQSSKGEQIAVVEPATHDEVMGTLEPEDDGAGTLDFIKKMVTNRQDHSSERGDYESEECCDACGQAECECEDVHEDNYEATQHSSSDHSVSPMSEKLSGGQKKLDKAPPFGKLTGADFAALRKSKVEESRVDPRDYASMDEEAGDQPATMEAQETCNECGGMIHEGSTCDEASEAAGMLESIKEMFGNHIQGVAEEVDTGQAGARNPAPSSKEHQDRVFAAHRERMKKDREEHENNKKQGVAEGSLEEVSLELAKRARDKATDDAYNDGDDLRGKEEGHSYRQSVRFQRYIDKKEPRAKGNTKKGVAEGSLEAEHSDPTVMVSVGSGNPEKLALSAAIKKYPGLGKAEDVKSGLAKQNSTKIGNYTVSAPMSGQEVSPGFKTEDSLNEWANSHSDSNSDEQFIADLNYMTKVISGGLNNIKQDQTTLPSTRVAATDRTNSSNTMAEMLRKLSGIN